MLFDMRQDMHYGICIEALGRDQTSFHIKCRKLLLENITENGLGSLVPRVAVLAGFR